MAADPPDTDPADRDPRERRMGRRDGGPETGVWLIVGGAVMVIGLVYVISALL